MAASAIGPQPRRSVDDAGSPSPRIGRRPPARLEVGEVLPLLYVMEARCLTDQDVDVLERGVDGLVNHPGKLGRKSAFLATRTTFTGVALDDGPVPPPGGSVTVPAGQGTCTPSDVSGPVARWGSRPADLQNLGAEAEGTQARAS